MFPDRGSAGAGSTPTLRIIETVADVPATVWDRVAGASFAHTHRWLGLMERHMPDHVPRYVLVHEGDELAAIALTTQLSRDQVPRMVRDPFQSVVADAVARRTMICRAPLGSGVSGLAVGETRLDPAVMVDAVLGALDARTGWSRSRPWIGHFPVPDDDAVLGPGLLRNGLVPTPSIPVASMAIPWKTYDEYLASLKGKWRVWIRGVRRKAHAAGLTAEFRRPRDVRVPDEQLHAYMDEVARFHGLPRSPLEIGFLGGLRERMNDDAVYVLLYDRGRFVAFGLGLYHRGTMSFPIVGIDYEVSKELKLVSMLYYEMVQCCIDDDRVDMLHLGVTNEDMKRRIGCTLTPRWWFMRSPGRLLNNGLQAGLRRKHGDARV